MVSDLVQEHKADWDVYLPAKVFSLCFKEHSKTKERPFSLLCCSGLEPVQSPRGLDVSVVVNIQSLDQPSSHWRCEITLMLLPLFFHSTITPRSGRVCLWSDRCSLGEWKIFLLYNSVCEYKTYMNMMMYMWCHLLLLIFVWLFCRWMTVETKLYSVLLTEKKSGLNGGLLFKSI